MKELIANINEDWKDSVSVCLGYLRSILIKSSFTFYHEIGVDKSPQTTTASAVNEMGFRFSNNNNNNKYCPGPSAAVPGAPLSAAGKVPAGPWTEPEAAGPGRPQGRVLRRLPRFLGGFGGILCVLFLIPSGIERLPAQRSPWFSP